MGVRENGKTVQTLANNFLFVRPDAKENRKKKKTTARDPGREGGTSFFLAVFVRVTHDRKKDYS